MTNHVIPDEAVEVAAKAVCRADDEWSADDYYTRLATAALEAAYPIMLSHEREETRLAHLDAVVNRDAVDRLERELTEAKATSLRDAAGAWREYLPAVSGYGKVQPVPAWLERRAEWLQQP